MGRPIEPDITPPGRERYVPHAPPGGPRLPLLLLLSAAACTPATTREDAKPSTEPSATSSEGKKGTLHLTDAIGRLTVALESRTGYERDKFHLWTDADHDGCDTRKEVLGADRSLVAVSLGPNRTKGDKDPAE
ncbi:hypothetical protein [Streptomyces platensis]